MDKKNKLDKVVAEAHRQKLEREQGYRERALKMYPWICGRCQREFTRVTLQELTVHHRDHNHDYNPENGGNWELLCLYCHDNEHQRLLDGQGRSGSENATSAGTYKAFADLAGLLKKE